MTLHRSRFLPPLVVILAILGGAVAVRGQNGADSGVPGLVRQVLQMLKAANQVNVRFTPPADVAPADFLVCEVANVASLTRRVEIVIIGDTFTFPFAEDVEAGNSTEWSITEASGRYHCKFTVVDGTRADIRGSLAIRPSVGSDKLMVPAE